MSGGVRQRLTGRVYSDWLAYNFEDATQAVGCCLRRRGCSMYVVGTHWRSTPIQGAYASSAGRATDAEGLRSSSMWGGSFDSDADLQTALSVIEEGTAGRCAEAKLSVRLALEGAARHGCDLAVLLGDMNTIPTAPEVGVVWGTQDEAARFEPAN